MIQYLQIILMLLAVFSMRPSLLGEEYTIAALCFSFFSLMIMILNRNRWTIPYNRQNILILFFAICIWTSLLLSSLFNNAVHLDYTIKAYVSNLIIILIFGSLLSEIEINKHFFKLIVLSISIFGYSSLFSLVLINLVGTETILIGKILEYNILFPFSLEYGVYTVPGLYTFHRFMGFFREPGIAQGFILWAFVYANYHNFSKWTKVGLIIGLVTTLSTIGILNFLLVILLLFIIKEPQEIISKLKRIFIALGSISGVFYLFYNLPFIGIKAKSDTHGVSLTDRSNNIYNAIENINLFGNGMYSSTKTHSGINLLAMLDEIGLIMIIAICILYFSPLFFRKQNSGYYFTSFIPLFMTSLFSQPLLDAPLLYLCISRSFI